jgi:integrase/recombinase XerD
VNKPVINVTANDLRGYIESCRKDSLKPATIHRKVVILKSFFKFLFQDKKLPEDPLDLVEVPPCPEPGKPRGITPEMLQKLFAAIPRRSVTALRDRAMFLLMAATGVRISEICGLNVKDVADADEKNWKALHVIGKGQKEREVHVNPEVWGVVVEYLQRRPDINSLPPESPLFVATERRNPIQALAKDRRLSVGSTYERFKRLCKKAGLPEEVSPHSLRHYFSCEADAAGASVESIRRSLGHSGLGTTQRYLQRVHRGINEAFAKTRLPKLSEVL